jgi:maleate isomerase
LSLRKVGLVTPYSNDVQESIVRVWKSEGIDCVAERHLGLQDNFAFSEIKEDAIASMVHDVAKRGCEMVAIVCTNMRGARRAPILEAETGIPIIDSIAVTLNA